MKFTKISQLFFSLNIPNKYINLFCLTSLSHLTCCSNFSIWMYSKTNYILFVFVEESLDIIFWIRIHYHTQCSSNKYNFSCIREGTHVPRLIQYVKIPKSMSMMNLKITLWKYVEFFFIWLIPWWGTIFEFSKKWFYSTSLIALL
jgi:hypothetical protein